MKYGLLFNRKHIFELKEFLDEFLWIYHFWIRYIIEIRSKEDVLSISWKIILLVVDVIIC